MTYIRRLILAVALSAGLAPAFAQVPPPVPALPDTERRTTYSISASTCACAVNFALYGDSTDYANWIEVFVNGVRMAQPGNWTLSSATGTIGSIPLPITNAVLTFTAPQTGTIQIVGARRPRRTSQFNEGAGVPTRNFNVVLSDLTAQNRELWDKTNDVTGRALISQPGNTVGLLPLPSACQSKFLGFDATGLIPQCSSGGAGSGNVVGPLSSTVGHFATWNNLTGTLLADHVIQGSDLPNPSASTLGGVQSLTCGANQWLNQISVAGVPVCAQPAVSNISGFGTGVATALGVNVGTAGAPVVNGGALGTPSSGTGTNLTGIPTTGLTGVLQAAQEPAHTGDCTNSASSLALNCTSINGVNQTTAWTTFAPALSCGTATFTVNSARFKTMGKTVWISIDYTITAIGTCTGGTVVTTFTLPATPQSGSAMAGRESAVNGIAVAATITAASATASMTKNANANWLVNERPQASGVYESQ